MYACMCVPISGFPHHKSGFFFVCPIFDFLGCNLGGFIVEQLFIFNTLTNKNHIILIKDSIQIILYYTFAGILEDIHFHHHRQG